MPANPSSTYAMILNAASWMDSYASGSGSSFGASALMANSAEAQRLLPGLARNGAGHKSSLAGLYHLAH